VAMTKYAKIFLERKFIIDKVAVLLVKRSVYRNKIYLLTYLLIVEILMDDVN